MCAVLILRDHVQEVATALVAALNITFGFAYEHALLRVHPLSCSCSALLRTLFNGS
jgi:hypothetical protein